MIQIHSIIMSSADFPHTMIPEQAVFFSLTKLEARDICVSCSVIVFIITEKSKDTLYFQNFQFQIQHRFCLSFIFSFNFYKNCKGIRASKVCVKSIWRSLCRSTVCLLKYHLIINNWRCIHYLKCCLSSCMQWFLCVWTHWTLLTAPAAKVGYPEFWLLS